MIEKKKPAKNSINNKYSTTRCSSRGLPITANIADLDENEIDKIINQTQLQKKQYSKSQVDLYKPLSKKEKIKVLEDLNNNSDMRIMLYSELFKEIKSQINSLSTFSTTQAYHKSSMDDIEEDLNEDEKLDEYCMSNRKKSSKKQRLYITNTPTFDRTQSKGYFDWKDSEENIGLIYVPHSVYKSNTLNSLDIMSNPKYMYKDRRKNSKMSRLIQL
jgi:hypothetical protein